MNNIGSCLVYPTPCWLIGIFTGIMIAWPSNGLTTTLKMVADSATGCQYVSYKNAGLHPRLDINGRQLCSSTVGHD
jgi:hypothetical protein